MIYIENNGKISKLSTDAPLTLTHSPVKLWDMAGWSVDGLEALLNSTPYQLLIDCLPVYGGEIVKAAMIWDEKAVTVSGGTFTAGAWGERDLNTKNDPDSLVTVASNAVTIAVAGKYLIRASAPANAVDVHQVRLNINNSSYVLGTSTYSPLPNYYGFGRSEVIHVATLTVNDVLRLEHRCTTTYNSYGFGLAQAWGVNIYSIMELIQWT